MTNKHY